MSIFTYLKRYFVYNNTWTEHLGLGVDALRLNAKWLLYVLVYELMLLYWLVW